MGKLDEAVKRLAATQDARAELNKELSSAVESLAVAERKFEAEPGDEAYDEKYRRMRDVEILQQRLVKAEQKVSAAESEHNAAVEADGRERLKAKSTEVVRAFAVVDANLAEVLNALGQADGLLAECANIAASLGLPTVKYQNKFRTELRRAVDWKLWRDSPSVWSRVLRAHYEKPLSEQIESLLLGDEVKEADTELPDNVVKLEKVS